MKENLCLDLGDILSRIEERYFISLPRTIVKAKYNRNSGLLTICIRLRKIVYSDLPADGLVSFHYDKNNVIVKVKILNLELFTT